MKERERERGEKNLGRGREGVEAGGVRERKERRREKKEIEWISNVT